MRHHPDELENLLPTGDEARAQHVVHAEGLGGRGGRRGRVVRGIRELLPQLQVVQDQPVAVVGYAQAVAVAKLELIQAASRAPVYAPSGRSAQSACRARRPPSTSSGPGPSRGNYRPGGSCRRRAGRRSASAGTLPGLPQSRCPSRPLSCGCPRRSWSSFSLGSRPSGGRRAGGRLRRRCSRRYSHILRLSASSWRTASGPGS